MKGKYMFKLKSSICFFPVFYGKKARLFYFVFMARDQVIPSCPVQRVAPVLEEVAVFNLCLKLLSKAIYSFLKTLVCHILFSYTKLKIFFL